MENDKTWFILKKDWLKYAESYRRSADLWRNRSISWTEEERQENFDAYTKDYERCVARAAKAPVKITLTYEDGRTEVIE